MFSFLKQLLIALVFTFITLCSIPSLTFAMEPDDKNNDFEKHQILLLASEELSDLENFSIVNPRVIDFIFALLDYKNTVNMGTIK